MTNALDIEQRLQRIVADLDDGDGVATTSDVLWLVAQLRILTVRVEQRVRVDLSVPAGELWALDAQGRVAGRIVGLPCE